MLRSQDKTKYRDMALFCFPRRRPVLRLRQSELKAGTTIMQSGTPKIWFNKTREVSALQTSLVVDVRRPLQSCNNGGAVCRCWCWQVTVEAQLSGGERYTIVATARARLKRADGTSVPLSPTDYTLNVYCRSKFTLSEEAFVEPPPEALKS